MRPVIAILLFVACASSFSTEELETFQEILIKERELHPRHFKFIDNYGSLREIDLDAPVDYELLEKAEKNLIPNEFWLFTRSNPNTPQNLYLNDVNSVLHSNFDPRKKTVFLVHGWENNGNSEPNPSSRTALLNSEDANVITFDWREVANAHYVTAVAGVPAAGRELGQFINWLTTFGLEYSRIHLVGYSLGAHLVGNAGRECNGQIARITGLDPAGPLWYYNLFKLSSTDAVYVEAIHTDGGSNYLSLGIGRAVAQVDFFPNGGINQPGCSTNSCNHGRAPAYFASSITYNHLIGQKCEVAALLPFNLCLGERLHMGNNQLSKNASGGIYRVNTLAEYPY